MPSSGSFNILIQSLTEKVAAGQEFSNTLDYALTLDTASCSVKNQQLLTELWTI